VTFAAPEKPILCIDDDPAALELRKILLERNGYEVLATTNTSEGLRMFKAEQVCLVIADQLLKDKTGTDLAREMKRLKQHVPILLYSGTVPQSLDYVDCFVLKTEPITKVLAFIRDVLTR